MISPVAEEAAKLADALIGKLGNPAADRLLEEFARHVAGHAELVDTGDCALCSARTATAGVAGEAARHLADAGRSLMAAVTVLLTPLNTDPGKNPDTSDGGMPDDGVPEDHTRPS